MPRVQPGKVIAAITPILPRADDDQAIRFAVIDCDAILAADRSLISRVVSTAFAVEIAVQIKRVDMRG
jgi:hypothetical protein